jgi:uncharacterized protein YndB with AHSA1/START domain
MNVETQQQKEKSSSTDRIEKTFALRAPRSRVWRAISDAKEFGAWFGVKFVGDFAAGKPIRGVITHRGIEHKVEFQIDRIEPERYFSYRWHPYAIDPSTDYSAEPTTLVEFILEDADGGTNVKILETGFDRIPLARRAEAFRMNEGGWTAQVRNLTGYVS